MDVSKIFCENAGELNPPSKRISFFFGLVSYVLAILKPSMSAQWTKFKELKNVGNTITQTFLPVSS